MTKISLFTLALAFAFGSIVAAPAGAQTAGPSKTGTTDQQAPKKEEPKHDPKTVAYEAAVKDLKRINGPIPIYVRKKEILAEISEDQLGKIMLC